MRLKKKHLHTHEKLTTNYRKCLRINRKPRSNNALQNFHCVLWRHWAQWITKKKVLYERLYGRWLHIKRKKKSFEKRRKKRTTKQTRLGEQAMVNNYRLHDVGHLLFFFFSFCVFLFIYSLSFTLGGWTAWRGILN